MRVPSVSGVVSREPFSHRLPRGEDLLVRGTAVVDLGLATALSVGGVVPMLATGDRERLRAEVPFYRDLARRGDASVSFPAPAVTPVAYRVMSRRPRYAPAGAQVSTISFASPFVPVNAGVGERYLRHGANGTVCVERWRHGDGPRPTVIVVHGFAASMHWFNSSFFSLPSLFRAGHDVALYVLPFHGARATRAPLSGVGLFTSGLAHFNEAIGHAICDLRIVLDALEDEGVQRVSATGFSLGGYVTALLGSVDARLAAVAPIAPVADIAAMWRRLFPLNQLMRLAERDPELGQDGLATALGYSSPLSYEPLVPRARRMIVGGLGDRLTPPEQARALWQHWQQPELHWFPGGHALHFGRGSYQRALLELFGSVAGDPAMPHGTPHAQRLAA